MFLRKSVQKHYSKEGRTAERKMKLQEKVQDKESKRKAREQVAVGVLFGADSDAFDALSTSITTPSILRDAATQLRDY